MLIYSAVMFFTAALFLWIGGAIYLGRTDMIHSYHQERVEDRQAYGKAVGKVLFLMAGVMLCSGVIGMLGTSGKNAVYAVALLFAGLGVGLVCFFIVQKKYNGGVF